MENLTDLLTCLNLSKVELTPPKYPVEVDSLLKSALFKQLFSRCSDNADRVRCILAQKKICDFIEKLAKQCDDAIFPGKDATKAEKYRMGGNRFFQLGDNRLENALAMYTQAIQHAPNAAVVEVGPSHGQSVTSKELALAYASRSAAYFNLKEFENSFEDIEASLQLGLEQFEPEEGRNLKYRKVDCFLELGMVTSAKDALVAAKPANKNSPEYISWKLISRAVRETANGDHNRNHNRNRSIAKKHATVEDLLKMRGAGFTAQPNFPNLNSNVAIRYDPTNGIIK